MKNRMIAIIAAAAMTVCGGTFIATKSLAQTPPPTVRQGTRPARLERHPEIRRAMRQLTNAMNTMKKAADDFHGHKEKAMDLTKSAIEELQAALRADRH